MPVVISVAGLEVIKEFEAAGHCLQVTQHPTHPGRVMTPSSPGAALNYFGVLLNSVVIRIFPARSFVKQIMQ